MEPNNTTENPILDANQLGAASGDPAVGGQNPQEPSIPLSELKSVLGKDFKDKDTALKSLKDTQSYVGKVGQLEKELGTLRTSPASVANTQDMSEVKNELRKVKDELWFADNAAYKPHRTLVEKFAKAEGKTFSEIVELPEFKDVFSKVQGFEQSQKLKTVLESNPRLASAQDKITKAQGLAASRSRRALGEAADIASQAVMDAYPDFLGN